MGKTTQKSACIAESFTKTNSRRVQLKKAEKQTKPQKVKKKQSGKLSLGLKTIRKKESLKYFQ